MYLDWQGFGVDPDIASRWLTSTADDGTYLSNPSNYSNPEVDAALQAAALALTQDERAKHLREAQNLITADVPAVWLYLWQAQQAAGPNVGGLSLPGLDGRHGQHRHLPRAVEGDVDPEVGGAGRTSPTVSGSVWSASRRHVSACRSTCAYVSIRGLRCIRSSSPGVAGHPDALGRLDHVVRHHAGGAGRPRPDVRRGGIRKGSAEDIERIRENLGLNDPLPVQYLRWLGQAAQGNFGYSIISHRPVVDLIWERCPPPCR